MQLEIREDELTSPEILALLERHMELMRSVSPLESVHALDVDKMRASDVTSWTAWRARALLGCCALKEISSTHGEIKSMHTTWAARRRGVATALLQHILAEAGKRGYQRLSLETGSMDAFLAARIMYAKHGFTNCEPFADYLADPNSVFMTRTLAGTATKD